MSSIMLLLDQPGRDLLADAIGESAETIMSVHRLRRGLCRAIVDALPPHHRAALVIPHEVPDEPSAYGDDPEAIWRLLRDLVEWSCVNASQAIALPLTALFASATGHACTHTEEMYYQLPRPVAAWPHDAVRRLMAADIPLMEAATLPLNMVDWRFGSAAAQIAEGAAAGAIVDGELVAAAFIGGRGDRCADVGIVTREDWRNQGLSTAAAALVCADIQAAGQIPVWGTSIENFASQKVAAKLGFAVVSRSVYICLT